MTNLTDPRVCTFCKTEVWHVGHVCKPRSITLPIAAPDRWLATNDRAHWSSRSAGVKTWRESAALHARRAKLTPLASPFTVTGVVHKPTERAYDLDGITPTIKACLDGLRDVGVITDDNYKHMRRFSVEPGAKGRPYLVLTLTELDPSTPFPPHPEGDPA